MSATSAILGPTATSASFTAAERVPVQTLDQQDFLKLLVAQMTSQDPLKPTQDTEFIAQMAQFSALEQSKTMQSDMAQMRGDQQFLQAYSLLGQTVSLRVDENTTAEGIVAAVQTVEGTPKLMVDGNVYDLGQVLAVTPTIPQVTSSERP
jgi:flagellar basal-body rod modification protein FlgD